MGNLRDYKRDFERLVDEVSRLSEYFLASFFIGELKEDTRLDVKMFFPTIGLAQLLEEKESSKMTSYNLPPIKPLTEPTPCFESSAPLPLIKRLTPIEPLKQWNVSRSSCAITVTKSWVVDHLCVCVCVILL